MRMEKHRPRSEEKDWKSRLQEWEQGADTQGWDSPGDGLWDRIADDLPEPPSPKSRRAAWIWWSTAGLLLTLIAVGSWNRPIPSDPPLVPVGADRPVDEVERPQAAARVSVPDELSATGARNSRSIVIVGNRAASSEENAETDYGSSSAELTMSPARGGADPGLSKTKQNDGKAAAVNPVPAQSVSTQTRMPVTIADEAELSQPPVKTAPLSPATEPIAEQAISLIPEEVPETTATVAPKAEQLDVLRRIPVVLAPLAASPSLNLGAPTPVMGHHSNWYLGLQASIPPARQQNQGPHRIRQQSFDPRLELWVGREVGRRWQIELGYAQEGSRRSRERSFVRRFDPQNEQLQNDQNVTVYKLNMDDSGSANQEVEVKLVRRPGQSILPGDRVLIQTDVQEQFRVRSVPVRVGYDLLRYRSWQLQALAGVEWQQQYRSLQVERVRVQHPWFDPVTLSDQQRQREQRMTHFRFTTGARAQVLLSPRLGLYVQPQWSWGNDNRRNQDFHLNGGAFWRF